jgi:hypothetical protein
MTGCRSLFHDKLKTRNLQKQVPTTCINMPFKKGDKIKVVAGKYSGKKGVVVGVATPLSYRLLLEDGDRRTLRRTSVERDDQPEPQQPQAKPSYEDILLQINTLQEGLKKLELTVKTLAASNQN